LFKACFRGFFTTVNELEVVAQRIAAKPSHIARIAFPVITKCAADAAQVMAVDSRAGEFKLSFKGQWL